MTVAHYSAARRGPCHGGITRVCLTDITLASPLIPACLMHDHAMEGTGGSAAVADALSPGDSSPPPPGLDRPTPESSSGGGGGSSSSSSSSAELGEKEQGLVLDPLLSSSNNDSSDDDGEVYELRQRGSRQHGFNYTAEEERAVVGKFDRRLVLFVAFLYMLSFLDRSSSSYPPLPPCRLIPDALSGRVWLVPGSRSSFLRPGPQRKPRSSSDVPWGPKL